MIIAFKKHTVNVDIFACLNFTKFARTDNFASIYICVFENIPLKWHNKSYFHVAHIFADILKT